LNDFAREPRSFWAIMIHNLWQAGVRRTVLTLRSLQQCHLEEWLPGVQVPSLVVAGGRDRIVPISWIGRVTALLPQGQVAVIKDARHVPNYSHPGRLAALVRAFMKSSAGTGKST
jgi:pimeloyl-ACP methyl ester carboxylesterase